MAHEAREHTPVKQYILPVLAFGLPEVRRLRRELESLEEFINGSEIRTPGTQPQLPRLSRICEALATDNSLNLLQTDDRQRLLTFIKGVETAAPQIHMSFAADPSSAFTAKMVTWMRANVHRYALIQIGLQPTIAAGCIVRTPNKVFDFSLRERLIKARSLLIEALEVETASAAQQAIVAAVAPAVAQPVSGSGAPAVPEAVPAAQPTVAQAAPTTGVSA
ncbi:MAG TPA: hypothetical protein VLE73_04155 [Candidatus Saccharimonadales bacterium]|nr:hypothetical protein [Candidatus Saccharimonadales bacterium]